MQKIIKIKDTLYECLGIMNVDRSNEKGIEYWKERYDADIVLKSGNDYYYCRTIIDAEFEDI